MKKRLNISFSGGRTSAVMTKLCLEQYSDEFDIIVTFANTGREHENTLKFVNDCDKNWGFNSVWLEAKVIHERRKGTKHTIVDYFTASRHGQPFEQMIKKYGIPNKSYPHCTRELKERPITSYLRSQGWTKGSYYTAIGIRADEMDRQSPSANKRQIIYPMIKYGLTVEDVKSAMNEIEWDLDLPGDHYGNCITCWKKTFRKLCTVAQDNPKHFDFELDMERKYRYTGSETDMDLWGRTFFRGNTETQWILNEAEKGNFKRYSDKDMEFKQIDLDNLENWVFWDKGQGCEESCEVFMD